MAVIFLYYSFNRLVEEAVTRTYDSNIISDVYDLKYEKLRVNLFQGSVSVLNVVMQPRAVPAHHYPYINSSFTLTAEEITLLNVKLMPFLKSRMIDMDGISIIRPNIRVKVEGRKFNLFPLRDSLNTQNISQEDIKRNIDSFVLDEFELVDASFNIVNSFQQREFNIERFNILLNDLRINQYVGMNLLSFRQVDLAIGEFAGGLQKGAIQRVRFQDFKIGIDSLQLRSTVDTLIFKLDNFNAGLSALDIQTSDSLFHLKVKSFNFSYKDKSIRLDSLYFKPNISDAAMQRRFKFQNTQIAGTVGSLKLVNVNADSLVHERGLYIDEIIVANPEVSLFRDIAKPVNEKRFPKYFGQQINAIPIPVLIKKITLTNVNLVNVERKQDGNYATVTLHRGKVSVANITNLSPGSFLTLNAEAYIQNKVHFDLRLDFSYRKPEFGFTGKFKTFNLPDLNPLLLAYTPAQFKTGVADEITFSGMANWTGSSGTMNFSYHDLAVDLDLHEKARWKSSAMTFAANSIVNSSNPSSAKAPPRIVEFEAERNMNKGFVNLIIKSVVDGVRETMIMSKKNRKTHQETRRKLKKSKTPD